MKNFYLFLQRLAFYANIFIYLGFLLTLIFLLDISLKFTSNFNTYFWFLWNNRILIIIEICLGFLQLYQFFKDQINFDINSYTQCKSQFKVSIYNQLWLVVVSIVIGAFIGVYVVLISLKPVYKFIVKMPVNGGKLICGRVVRETSKNVVIRHNKVLFKVYKSKGLLVDVKRFSNIQDSTSHLTSKSSQLSYKLCIKDIYTVLDDYSVKNLILFGGKFEKIMTASNNLYTYFYQIKLRMVANLSDVMGQDNASFFISMLFGGSTLSQNLVDKMKEIGIIHIVAVSGYNIVLFFQLAEIFLNRLKRYRILFEILLLVIFYLFIGSSPPVDRAFISFIVVRSLVYLGIDSTKLDRFLLSSFLLLIIKPIYIFSVSFYLTLTATFVVIFVLPRFEERLEQVLNKFKQFCLKRVSQIDNRRADLREKVLEYILNIFSGFVLNYVLGSILVFLFLSPIIWIFFKSFNIKSIFYNILILPIIDILVPIGYLIVWLSYFKYGSYIVAFMVGPLLGLINVISGIY